MASEYLVNSADLTSVADAIREKGGTSEQLVFPFGFVTAIEGIKGGADLNFEIVGGTTQPSNPKENTVWINTSTAITSWVISEEEPGSPASGMVWLQTGSSDVEIKVLAEEELYVGIAGAKQYKSNTWETVNIMAYVGGEWIVPWDGSLYDAGNEYVNITGGWYAENFNSGSTALGYLNKYDTYMQPHLVSSSTTGAVTSKAVDLTGFTTLNVTYSGNSGGNVVIVIAPTLPSASFTASATHSGSSATITKSLSLGSAVNGMYKIGIRAQQGSSYVDIHKVWLS